MGSYLDTSWAELRALTRARRAMALVVRRIEAGVSCVRYAPGQDGVVLAPTPRNEKRAHAWKKREYAAGNRRCFWCGCGVRRQGPGVGPWHPQLATVDHYIPLGKQGVEDETNYVMCCLECNDLKGDLMPDEWLALLEQVMGGIAIASNTVSAFTGNGDFSNTSPCPKTPPFPSALRKSFVHESWPGRSVAG